MRRERRQAGRARCDAGGGDLLHTGAAARLHHPDHCGRAEHGGEGRLIAAER